MGNILFWFVGFSLFLQFSFGAINFSGINRNFLGMYRGVLESSIIYLDSSGQEIYPYFDENKLEETINKYLDKNIKKYVNTYRYSLLFFDQDDGLICTSRKCSAVKISLEADINYFFHFKKAYSYFIKDHR